MNTRNAFAVGLVCVAMVASAQGQSAPPIQTQQLSGNSSGGNILLVPNIRSRDLFGTTIAADDSTAVIGAPRDDVFVKTGGTLRVGHRSGAAYIFQRNPASGEWSELHKIFPSKAEVARTFAESVALAGDLLLIGDPGSTLRGSATGAAYVFRRHPPTGRWLETQALTAADASEGEQFGTSVAIDGERLLVGALSGVNNQGAAYIFEPGPSGIWQQRQKLVFPALGFGRSVALDDDTAVVGAPSDSTSGRSSGSVFIYRRNAITGRWGLADRLFWPEAGEIMRANFDGTGVEVIVSDAFGAKGITVDSANGKIYWTSPALGKIRRANIDGTGAEDVVTRALYVPEGLTIDETAGKLYWTASFLGQLEASGKIFRANLDGSAAQELMSPDLFPPDGIALDPAGGKMYYAIPASRIERANLTGTAAELIVPRSNARWIAVHGAAGKMYFTEGFRVRRGNLDGSALEDLVSEQSPPEGIALDVTRGFVYWAMPEFGSIRRAHLDGSGAVDVVSGINRPFGVSVNPINGAIYWTTPAERNFEEFGTSLALEGETLMVGASGFPRGAVHAFQFDAATGAWQSRQQLTAPGVGNDFDGFGLSIDLSGDRLVVGAPLENDQGFLSGGAYLFRRDPSSGVWGASERMRASNGAAADLFGQSVALGADSVLIGAPERDLSSAVSDAGLTYVFDLQTSAVTERHLATVDEQPAAPIASPQATVTFNTELKVRWPNDPDLHRPVLTQCDQIAFSTSFNRLDSLGARFGSLVGQIFGTTLSTGAWFDGSETLAMFRGIELNDRDLDTVEFTHTVPCLARAGWTAFTAIQGVAGATSRRNVNTKFSFVWFFMPPF